MTTELLTDLGHTRADLQMMEAAIKRSIANPEIPIPEAIIKAMPKIAGTILLNGSERGKLAAGKLLLSFLEYNKSLNPPEQRPQQTVVNVGVNVDNRTESSKALQFIERFRQGRISGEPQPE